MSRKTTLTEVRRGLGWVETLDSLIGVGVALAAIIGAVIALVREQHVIAAILAAAAFGMFFGAGVIGILWRRWHVMRVRQRPNYRILSLSRSWIFSDSDSHRASYEHAVKLMPLSSYTQYFSWKYDWTGHGSKQFRPQCETPGCSFLGPLQVDNWTAWFLHLGHPLPYGKTIDLAWSQDFLDDLVPMKPFLTATSSDRNGEIELRVVFTDQRQPTHGSVRVVITDAFVENGRTYMNEEIELNQNHEAHYKWETTVPGREYSLKWTW